MLTLEFGTKKPINGIEVVRHVSELTKGIWKPSPGSIYYLLNELEKKGLISLVTLAKNPPYDYVTTKKGQEALTTFSKAAIETAIIQMTFVKMTLQFSSEQSIVDVAELVIHALKSTPSARARLMDRMTDALGAIRD